MIGITEPRRVAAISMASRVAYELNLTNEQVSYQIRYEGTYKKETTRIKFMTDGVLLKEIQNDFLLTNYSCIVIDEAHERSVATDVLIGLLSRVVPIRCRRNDPLRLVIMSATMRIEEFLNNKHLFKIKPKIINIDARQYPVTLHFNKQTPKNYIEQAYKKICQIHRQLPSGGILVFVTGQQEVQTLCHRLRQKFPMKTDSLDEPQFKSKKKKEKSIDEKSSLGIIDDEELEHLQSDVDEEEGEKEGSITSDLDDEDIGVQGITVEPLYVLPLYAILSSEKQGRVCLVLMIYFLEKIKFYSGFQTSTIRYTFMCYRNKCC
jgi:ATP-dependent RNA helicase DHX37/DHR1